MGDDRRDVWDFLTLGFWTIFFAIGLAPELFFYAMRRAAAVPSSTALINSSAFITLALTSYLAVFAFRQCRASGLGEKASQGKALEIVMLGLVAFLEIPAKGASFEARTLLEIVLEFGELPGRYLQTVVLFVGLSKVGAWLYLYSLVLRYHAFANRAVFTRIPSLFPSMRRHAERETDSDAERSVTQLTLPDQDSPDSTAETEQG